MRFSDFKVGVKLSVAFAMLLALTLTLGGVALWQMERMDRVMSALGEDALPSVAEAGNIRAQWNRIRRVESLMLMGNTADNQKLAAEIARVHASIKISEANFLQLDLSDQEKQLVAAYRVHRDKYLAAQKHFLEFATDDVVQIDQLQSLYAQDAEPAFIALAETVGKLSALSQGDAKVLRAHAETVKETALRWVIAGMASSAALSLFFALVVTRAVANPAAQALGVANRIAAGDLSAQVPSAGRDEMGQLMQALESMRQQLLHVVQDVRRNADSVAVASEEIAMGSVQLSSRTEEQAAALEQTAASMEELSTTVQMNADSAQKATAQASDAADVAAQAGDAVANVVTTMGSIREASSQITDIVGVIESIAFQTNILALNAAVEAARAGEQGRGFAVVAGEVRMLAGRCADAAKEIKHVVSTSGDRIVSGSQVADKAGETMVQVVNAINRVNALVASISASSAEQSAGVAQIGQVINELDTNTQKNAALVEENAAASESLKMQAQALVRSVSIFKT